MPSPDPLSTTCIIGELSCIECNYQLLGLSVSDCCPECGMSVETSIRSQIDLGSLHGRPLAAARTIAISVSLLAIGICFSLLTRPIVAVDFAMLPFEDGSTFSPADLSSLRGAIGITASIGLVGILMMAISRRIIANVSSERPLPPRRRAVVIWAIVALIAIDALLLASIFGPSSWIYHPGQAQRLSWPIATLLMLRTVGHGTLLVLLCAALSSLGWRSDRYQHAGTSLQAAGPMLATLGMECTTLAAWMLRDSFSTNASGHPFLIAWLVFSTLCGLGGLYLLANTAWVVKPLFRASNRLDQIVGLRVTQEPASMADPDRRHRSP